MEKAGTVRFRWFGVSFGILLIGCIAAAQVESVSGQPDPSPTVVRQGKRLYERRCVFCHGSRGRGNGPVSRGIFPKPRNFERGIFKISSTASGLPPTDGDLFETINRGMPGTMMPSFSNLRDDQQWALVYYVKSFYTEPGAPSPDPIALPDDETGPTAESLARGRNMYLDAECWKCHGMWGRGDGPSSGELVDDWGFPIRVADLNQPKLLRGGHSPGELYRSIAAGVGGTPMPSWVDSLTPEQTWDLVHYLRSRMSE